VDEHQPEVTFDPESVPSLDASATFGLNIVENGILVICSSLVDSNKLKLLW